MGREARLKPTANLQNVKIYDSFIFYLDFLGNDLVVGQRHLLHSFCEPGPVGMETGKTSGAAQVLPLGLECLQ